LKRCRGNVRGIEHRLRLSLPRLTNYALYPLLTVSEILRQELVAQVIITTHLLNVASHTLSTAYRPLQRKLDYSWAVSFG